MKDLRDLKDLTIHDVQSILPTHATSQQATKFPLGVIPGDGLGMFLEPLCGPLSPKDDQIVQIDF